MKPELAVSGRQEPQSLTFDADGSPHWSSETSVAEVVRHLGLALQRFIFRAKALRPFSDGCFGLEPGSGALFLWEQCETLASVAHSIVVFAGQPDTIWRKTAPGIHAAGPLRPTLAHRAFADVLHEVMFWCPRQQDGSQLFTSGDLQRLESLAAELTLYQNEQFRACDGAGMPAEYRRDLEIGTTPVETLVPPVNIATANKPPKKRTSRRRRKEVEPSEPPSASHMLPVHIEVLKWLRHCRAAQTRAQLWDHFIGKFGRDKIAFALEHMHIWKFVHCPPGSTNGASIQDAGLKWLEEHERSSGTPATKPKKARN